MRHSSVLTLAEMNNTARNWIVLACFIHIVMCQDDATITVSRSPVYNGESVTLTCTLAGMEGLMVSATIDAFNETRKEGTLICSPSIGRNFHNSGTGRFLGYNFSGCDAVPARSPRISVSVDASPSWDLDYRCTFSVFKTSLSTVQNLTSASSRLSVWVLPKVPSLLPGLLVFDETDNLTLECNSRDGTPAAVIDFVVVHPKSGNSVQNSGSTSVSLNLPGPATDWHNAAVTCRVINHNFLNMTARGVIRVNHISARHEAPLMVNTYSSSQTLDCSDTIISFPMPSYMWWLPGDAHINERPPSNSGVLTVPQGRSGFFVCIAVNKASAKIVLTTYRVTSVLLGAEELIEWLIPVFCLVIVGLIVALAVLYKRTHLKMGEAAILHIQNEPKGTSGTHVSPEQRESVAVKLHPEDCQYQSLNLQMMNEQSYAQFAAVPRANDTTAYETFQS